MPFTKIESVDGKGRGVARIQGKVTFVEGAIAGEVVSYSLTKRKPGYNIAKISSLIRESAARVSPRCDSFGVCGGCSMQHIDTATQVSIKQRVLEDNLSRIGKVAPDIIFPAIYGDGWRYRRRARLSARFVRKKGLVLVGFREKGNSFVAELHHCYVIPRKVSEILRPLGNMISSLSIKKEVPQIEMAASDSVIALVIRVMDNLSKDDQRLLATFAKQHSCRIFLQPRGIDSIYLFYPQDQPKNLYYSLPEFNLEIAFSPSHFTQINFAVNRVLVRRAVALLDPQKNDLIADYFCGVGNFSLAIARTGGSVVGYEVNESLVKQAYLNSEINGLDKSVRFITSNLFSDLKNPQDVVNRFDKCLIDPPRDGAENLINNIGTNGPDRIVYVSCNAATLARDSGVLVRQKGYTLKGAGLVNMFPHTSHCEAIAMFEKR